MTAKFTKWKFFCIWLAGLEGLFFGGCQLFLGPSDRIAFAVDSLRCEYLTDPLGIDTPRPRLSWVIHSARQGVFQSAYQILVASSEQNLAEGRADIWDSGKVLSGQSVNVEYAGPPLKSAASYFWKVRVWDRQGWRSPWSRPACWTMGLLNDQDWKAEWIHASQPQSSLYPLPIFRKTFAVKAGVQKAFVFVSGLGHYELYLNGGKVGDHFLAPAWSVYEKTVYYDTFDITDALREGPNAFGVMLGKGFYNTKGDRRIHFVRADRLLKLILQARIVYKDGSEQIVCTDDSWKWMGGPYLHNAILGGSSYDAQRLPAGWAEPGFDDSQWFSAERTNGPGGRLSASMFPPMKTVRVFKPVRIEEPEPGYFVYDFGQNASFVPRITVAGPAGSTVRMTPAEQRHGQTGNINDGRGRVNQAGLGKPNYWEYTLRGDGEEVWMDAFCYTGFQYLEISGAVPEGFPNPSGLPVVKDLSAVQVRSACERVGTFTCSKPLFNAIDRLIDWAVQSNMAHVLTDCPQREKLGWLEQTYLMGPSIFWNYDAAAYFGKIARDIRDSQDSSGQIFTVAPSFPVFQGAYQYSPEWGAAGVFVPWLTFQWYQDRRILEENYEMMKRFVDWMEATSDNLIPVSGLGDWYDYGHGQSLGPSRFTPKTLTAAAIFYGCAQTLCDAAGVLGKPEDSRRYSGLCEKIRHRFNSEFFDGRAVYQNFGSPQTANAMALVFALPPQEARLSVLETLIEDLRRRNWQQTAGDIGFHYLVRALMDAGRSDVLYRIASRTDVGSYGWILQQGWTSLPEAWDATTTSSMNHLMLGHIQQWFGQGLVGIRPHPEEPGFRKFLVWPEPVEDLQWCEGTYCSLYGPIEVSWSCKEKEFTLNLTVPCNTAAEAALPADSPRLVRVNGKPLGAFREAVFLRMQDGRAVILVPSGRYQFQSKLP
ncbi:MAG TPA: family 78 glycoside hydrolase catalytic domain [Anaerohalosphaeraceae bacterium]|nr:family 78 glycoside hydrolase catalytic domain [Anaerohalosphaeraceae bacterium]HPP56333.1 family 78 glycoside hydrolase catalytic domain [Anaerohalosphaeraceae bacterium]